MIFEAAYQTDPPVFRQRARVTEDSYGDPVESWASPVEVRLLRAIVDAPSSTENEQPDSDRTTADRELYAPGMPDVHEHDRIRVGSEVWRVDGLPVVHRPLASEPYTVARLVRVANG
jgi:head-tail adaptor